MLLEGKNQEPAVLVPHLTFDLNKAVRAIAEQRRRKHAEFDIEMSLDLEDGLSQIAADTAKLRTVVQGLLRLSENSIIASKAAGKVYVRTAETPDNIQFSIEIGSPARFPEEAIGSISEYSEIVRAYGGELSLWEPCGLGWTIFMDLPAL
jgi:light-regulated signal transduction histidine kinase (bacteriophytochrome)